jgi:drug/metabolite transporter (DMT)-like permease
MTQQQREGLFFILLSSIGYALLPVFTKNIYAGSDLRPADMAVWRFAFAVPAMWLAIRVMRLPAPENPLPRRALLGMGAIYSVAGLTMNLALEKIPVSLYITLLFTYPAMVSVLSIFLGEPLPRIGWLALILTTAGVILTAGEPEAFAEGNLGGIAATAANALAMAFYYVLFSRVMAGKDSLARATTWVLSGTLITLLLFSLLQGLRFPQALGVWANLVGVGTIGTAFPIFTLNAGVQRIGAPRASIISSIEPALATIVAVLLLGEAVPGILQIAGMALIAGSIVLLQLRR